MHTFSKARALSAELPQTVRQALGEEAAQDMLTWLNNRLSVSRVGVTPFIARQKVNVLVSEQVSGLFLAGMFDGSLAFNSTGAAQAIVGQQNPAREEMMLNGGSFYDFYETRDRRLLSVGSLEPKFWTGFCKAIGRTDLIKRGMNLDTANQQIFKHEIREAIQAKTLAEWGDIFAQYDVCVEPVLTTFEALEHPQTVARHMLVGVPRPNGSVQQQIGTPIKLSNHTPEYKHIGVKLGVHTKQILSESGFSESEIEALEAQGVVASNGYSLARNKEAHAKPRG